MLLFFSSLFTLFWSLVIVRELGGGVVGALVGSTKNMVGSCSRPTKNWSSRRLH